MGPPLKTVTYEISVRYHYSTSFITMACVNGMPKKSTGKEKIMGREDYYTDLSGTAHISASGRS